MVLATKQTNGAVEVAISLLTGHLKVYHMVVEVVQEEEAKVEEEVKVEDGAGGVVAEAIIVNLHIQPQIRSMRVRLLQWRK